MQEKKKENIAITKENGYGKQKNMTTKQNSSLFGSFYLGLFVPLVIFIYLFFIFDHIGRKGMFLVGEKQKTKTSASNKLNKQTNKQQQQQ